MKRELDTADRKIVELLQEDARLPLKSIADKVSLTSVSYTHLTLPTNSLV